MWPKCSGHKTPPPRYPAKSDFCWISDSTLSINHGSPPHHPLGGTFPEPAAAQRAVFTQGDAFTRNLGVEEGEQGETAADAPRPRPPAASRKQRDAAAEGRRDEARDEVQAC
eukprot:gene9136-biopygen16705